MNNNDPLVTIISGYYNREDFIEDSVKSLINQTYKNLEILIFDDCSTDNTYLRLKEFEKDPRVHIIRNKKNKGFTKSLIDTIELSKGDFIAIHGSGDFSYPERIEKQLNLFQKDANLSAVGCEDRKVFRDGTIGKTNRWPAGDFYKNMLKGGKRPINGSHVMLRKSIYKKVGGYREFFEYAQDSDLFSRLSLVSKYDIVPEILYQQQRHVEGSVSGDPIKRLKQIYYMNFAVECAKMRKEKGYDYIDILGKESFIAIKKNKEITNKLSTHAIKLYLDGKVLEFEKVVQILKTQKTTFRSGFVIMVYSKMIPFYLSNFIFSFLKNLNSNSFIRELKAKLFNVNKI
ncbi:MAG: hypothetical protein BalsKO_20310 [Balneolaceae bacterium]